MAYSDYTIQNVWEKGNIIPWYDPNVWRKDQCGAWIGCEFYGNRNSQYGWEIDHITPQSEQGGENLFNLRPLQWENNAEKSAGKLSCPITSSGVNNIRR